MSRDNSTNFLYLSRFLPKRHKRFYVKFVKALEENGIKYGLLPGTKDIWCRDYMPIQTAKNRFIQFNYAPSYLKGYKHLITDTKKVCKAIGVKPILSDIILDGGNAVASNDKVIFTSRIFNDNPVHSKDELMGELKGLLKVREVIILPEDPDDIFGHADGMVRFINEHTVLVNDYEKESKAFKSKFYSAIRKAGLKMVHLPYNPYRNAKKLDATGCYINYLQVGRMIFVPSFGMIEDNKAIKALKKAFKGYKLVQIPSKQLAKRGGVLNCVSWDIIK